MKLNCRSSGPQIGAMLKKFAPFLKLYTDYIKNFDTATSLITLWTTKSSKFMAVLDKLQVCCCYILSFISYIPQFINSCGSSWDEQLLPWQFEFEFWWDMCHLLVIWRVSGQKWSVDPVIWKRGYVCFLLGHLSLWRNWNKQQQFMLTIAAYCSFRIVVEIHSMIVYE